jgi:hypothetical protein
MRTSILKQAILGICLLTVFIAGHAQTADSFYLQITHVFENIETNRVSNGLLRDYGLDFADVENFDGVQLSDTNFVYPNIWYDLYTSLYTYRFNNYAASLPLPDTVFNNIDSLWTSDYVPLSLMLFQYDKLRDDADSNNLITVSGDQLYDKYVSGVWQNPYEEKNIFAVTTNRDIFKESSITFRLPSSLIFTNYTNIQTYEADFGDGNGWQTITPDNDITINYADTGVVTINFRVTLTNSQQFESRSKIGLYFSGSGQRPASINGSSENSDFPIAATANHSGGTLQIHYSSANATSHHITKPLIIAEGFDPWKLTKKPNVEFDDFWLDNERGFYGPTLQALLENDYDIIYIDYNDGTDAIERNAALVIDAINQVNTWKAQAGSSE